MSTPEELLQLNPFPGLRAFQPSEADRFFGRQQQIDELVRRVAQVPLVAVAGGSGCGKSSLVLAGLLNELARPEVARDTAWRAVVMRPGNAPIAELARKLAALFAGGASEDGRREASLEGGLRLGGLALIEAVRVARLPEQVRVLVVVDQFEEIFRFEKMTDAEEAAAFVKLLLNAARDPLAPVSVVLTMRSDALGACAAFRDLPEAVNRGLYLVPRLTREQRTEAIVRPVEWRGQHIAPSLVQRLLNDVSDEFDDLPVMQHVLTRTWYKWALSGGNRPIQLADYEAAGGAGRALSDHADEAYDSLAELQPLVQRVFRALTERTAEGQTNRRPLKFGLLRGVVDAPADQVVRVIERFRRADTAFLVPAPPEPLVPDRVIDISHESLIRLWARLREWVLSETKARTGMSRLVQAARAWDSNKGDLWGRRDLEGAGDWLQSARPNGWWVGLGTGADGSQDWELAKRFLAASKRAVRVRRLSIVGTAAAMVVMLIAWGATEYHLEMQVRSGSLASIAILQSDEDPARSAHIALAALGEDSGNARAEYALRSAMAELDTAHAKRIVDFGEPLVDARYSGDHSTLVVAGNKQVHLLNAGTFEKARGPIAFGKPVLHAWLMSGNRWLLVQHVDAVVLQPLDGSAPQPLECPGANNTVYGVAVSADLRQLALGCRDGQIERWDLGGEAPRRHRGWSPPDGSKDTVTALAFSHDAAYLASGNTEGVVRIWNPGRDKPVIDGGDRQHRDAATRHSEAINDIAFDPTRPEFLVTGSDDTQAIVWKLALPGVAVAKGETTAWPLRHNRRVTMVRFAPHHDRYPILTISGKQALLWDNEKSTDARGHDDWVWDANMSDDGNYIATASSDGTARVWSTTNVSPVARLRGHRAEVTRAFFVPGSQDVLTTSRDGTLRVWALKPPSKVLASQTLWELGAAQDPSGRRVVACGERNLVWHCSVLDLESADSKPVKLASTGASEVIYPNWSADGTLLLGVHMTSDIYRTTHPVIWNSTTGEEVTPEWIKKQMTASFGSASPQFVTVQSDGEMAIWDLSALKEETPVPRRRWGPSPGRWWATLSPDGEWIAAIDGNGAQLWRVNDPKAAPLPLAGHRGRVTQVRFSADSRFVVTASGDRTARVWPVAQATGEPAGVRFIELVGGHTSSLSAAAFSPDGTLVVTASADHTIQVWSALSGNPLLTLRVHADSVNDVQFSSDGQSILSASDDGTIRLTRCEVCRMTTTDQLRARVRNEVPLTAADDEAVRRVLEASGTGWWARLLGPARRR